MHCGVRFKNHEFRKHSSREAIFFDLVLEGAAAGAKYFGCSRPILGIILFFAGVELALVVRDIKLRRQNLFVLIVTAGTAMWNMGVAYLAGLILCYGLQRGWIKV